MSDGLAEVLAAHQWHHARDTHCTCGFRTPLAQLAVVSAARASCGCEIGGVHYWGCASVGHVDSPGCGDTTCDDEHGDDMTTAATEGDTE